MDVVYIGISSCSCTQFQVRGPNVSPQITWNAGSGGSLFLPCLLRNEAMFNLLTNLIMFAFLVTECFSTINVEKRVMLY